MSSPYGQYFAYLPNRTLIDAEKLKSLKGKPHFGDKEWKVGDTFLHCIVEEKNNNEVIDLIIKSLSHRHIIDVERDYEYVRMCSHTPVFKLKET
jgi:hypothetical protein